MKSIFRRGVKILAAVLVSLVLIPSGIVHAASDYDSIVAPAASWAVTDADGNTHIASLADAINNVTDPQLKQSCQASYSVFMQMDYRLYDVYQPNRYGVEQYARVFGTNDIPGVTQWTTSPDGSKQAYSRWHNFVGISLKYDNGNVVAISCGGDGTGDNYGNIFYAAAAANGFTPVMIYQVQGFQPDYPPEYAGASIFSSDIGGKIVGNVQCANTNNIISAVHINPQSGLDGNAKIINDGMGGVNYRYYLSQDSPYYLTVLCDGDMFTGPTVTSDFYSLYNWVCTNTIPGQDGNLHVCAAS